MAEREAGRGERERPGTRAQEREREDEHHHNNTKDSWSKGGKTYRIPNLYQRGTYSES